MKCERCIDVIATFISEIKKSKIYVRYQETDSSSVPFSLDFFEKVEQHFVIIVD